MYITEWQWMRIHCCSNSQIAFSLASLPHRWSTSTTSSKSRERRKVKRRLKEYVASLDDRQQLKLLESSMLWSAGKWNNIVYVTFLSYELFLTTVTKKYFTTQGNQQGSLWGCFFFFFYQKFLDASDVFQTLKHRGIVVAGTVHARSYFIH